MSITSITKEQTEGLIEADKQKTHIKGIVDDGVTTLEDEKIAITKGEKSKLNKPTDLLEENIREIKSDHNVVVDQFQQKEEFIKKRKESIDLISENIHEMDKKMATLLAEKNATLEVLDTKKAFLRERLGSIAKLDVLINALTYKIYEMTHAFDGEMDALNKQKEELLKSNLTESEMELALAEIDNEIQARKSEQIHELQVLEEQRISLRDESENAKEKLNDTVKHMRDTRNSYLDQIREMEAMKLHASPSELIEINKRLAALNKDLNDLDVMFENEMGSLTNLTPQEKLDRLLELRGLRLTASGRILTGSGRILTLCEAKRLGLLDGIDLNLADLVVGDVSSRTSTTRSSSNTTMSGMSSSDVHYLKTVVGKPLTLALAEITAKQPRDPIHYLAHWLFKYRYNQEVDEEKKIELEKLLEERKRLADIQFHLQAEDCAKAALLDLVGRVDRAVDQREIERELRRIEQEAIAREAENEELEQEARDQLGVYDGPSVGQKL